MTDRDAPHGTDEERVLAARIAIDAARQALEDARQRLAHGAPDAEAAVADAARRYRRAQEVIKSAEAPASPDGPPGHDAPPDQDPPTNRTP